MWMTTKGQRCQSLYEFLSQELCVLSESNKQEQLLYRQDAQWTGDGKAQGIMFTPKTDICYYFLCISSRLWSSYWSNYLPATSAQEGWWKALFSFPCVCHQVKSFHYWGCCCRSYLSFPRKDRKKEFSWGSCHTTRLYQNKAKENWFRCTTLACFVRDARWELQLWALLWKEALQNTTMNTFAFGKQGPVICILKGTKQGQGKHWPSGMYWLLKTKKKTQYKNRLRNKILKYHWLLFHSSGSPSWSSPLSYMSSTPDVHRPWELHLPVQRQVTAYHWWYLLLLVIEPSGHTRKRTSFISVGIWENLTAYCAMEPM